MKKLLLLSAAAALAPGIAAAQMSEKRESSRGNEASEQISLTTYVLQAIAALKPSAPVQEKLQACVSKISAFAPGGGDSTRQQRGYSGSVPLPQVMAAALTMAAPQNRAAATCARAMGELSMKFNEGATVDIGRDGAPTFGGAKKEIGDYIGERLVCGMALSDISTQIERTLAQSPPRTEEEAVTTAAAMIADQMQLSTKKVVAAAPELLHPAYTIGDNGGSTRPYTPLQMGMRSTISDSPTVTGTQVSTLAQATSNVASVAVGGIYSYTTRPIGGYVMTYDGKSMSISQGGRVYYDASTLAGRHGTVTISGTGAYSASASETGPEFRSKAIEEASICGLAINDVASQLTRKFLAPTRLPAANSPFSQKAIKSASIQSAFDRAGALVKGKKVEQDLDGRGSAWRINQYSFALHDSGIKVVFAGQEWFDYGHISGRGYTVRASSSGNTSSGYTTQ